MSRELPDLPPPEDPDEWFRDDGLYERASYADDGYPTFGPYENRELVSALRKDVKLGRTEQAMFWLTVMLHFGKGTKGHKQYIARQLWIMAAEDLFDQAIVLHAFAVFQMTGVCQETDHLYQLVYRMCQAEKLHSSPHGREMDRIWGEAEGRIKNCWYRKIPSYAVDRHTRRGASMLWDRSVDGPDERFSGHTWGRAQTQWLWDRWGKELHGRIWEKFCHMDPEFRDWWADMKVRFGENVKKGRLKEDHEPKQETLL